MQKTLIIGNLGGDPDMRFTPDGDSVTNFSVAVNYKTQDGDKTTWFRVSAWGKLAENCNQYLLKGRQVYVEGVLQSDEHGGPRTWTAQDGTVRASYELRAFNVQFLQGGGDNQQTSGPPRSEDINAPVEISDDEIPF